MLVTICILLVALMRFRHGQSTNSVSCLVIGDWGKGGESGTTASRSFDSPIKLDHSINSLWKLLSPEDNNDKNNRENNNQEKEKKNEAGGTNQVAVATAMAREVERLIEKPSFVLALGDNFYTKGMSVGLLYK